MTPRLAIQGFEFFSHPTRTRFPFRYGIASVCFGKFCCSPVPHCDSLCQVQSTVNLRIMTEVIIKLPDALAGVFGATDEARSRRLAEAAAIEEYRTGRLSQRQVGEMLGLDYWQTERFLSGRGVAINYSLGDLQADRATLDEVLPHP